MYSDLIESEEHLNLTQSFSKRLLDQESADPYLERTDPNLQVSEYILDTAGSELGFFAFLMLGCIYILLNQVDGKIFRLKIFMMNRDFNLINNEAGLVVFINWTLRVLSWLSLLMPFVSLAVWASGLIIRAKDFHVKPIGGISVLLVGLAFFFFSFGILKIKWNNYQFKVLNGVCLFLAISLLTAYQFVVIFLDETSNSYFGFSSVFLSINGLTIVFTVFLNSGIEKGSIQDLLQEELQKGQPRDPLRDQDFLEEINEERANKSYFPTLEDIVDLFTIANNVEGEDDMGSAFGGGLQYKFRHLKPEIQRLITACLWCLATGILVIYSYVIYWKMDYSRLGFVTMIAVLLTDVFIYLIWNSRIIETPSVLCISVLLNRLLLYVFGGNYWIYGYMLLYLIYGAILSFIINKKRFPFEDAYHNINLNNIHQRVQSYDVSKAPEFLLIFITTIYVILFVVLYVTVPRGVPLLRLTIDNWDYPYYINAVFCLLIIATFFSLVATYRLFIRKKRRIEPHIHFYFKKRKIDVYWIFITISFILMAAIGLICYWISKEISFFLVIIFVSVFIILYLNGYLHYVMNDYNILQNIEDFNVKIRKHNERLGQLKEKVVNIKKDLKEGKTTAIGEHSLGLAQNILKQDKEKKQQVRQAKRIQQANEELYQSQKTNQWANQSGAIPKNTLNKSQYGSNQTPVSPSKGTTFGKAFQNSNFNSIQRQQEFQKSDVIIKVQNTKVDNKIKTNVVPENELKPKGTLMTPHQLDDADNLINEELANNKNKKDDDIYEGGEEENENQNENYNAQLDQFDKELEEENKDDDDDSTDDEFDPEADDDQADEKKMKKRLMEIRDWRKEMNWFVAFFAGKLRENDYQIIYSIFVAHIAIIIMAILVSVDQESVLGVTIAVPLIHYSMAAFALSKHLNTDAKMSAMQYFFFFLAYAIQYGWGIASIYITYDSSDLDADAPGAAGAGAYIVVYLMVIPFITSCLSAIAKWIDDKGKFTFFFLIQIILSALQGIGMLVLAYVYMTYVQGIVISVICLVIAYIVLQVWIYVKNDYYMPTVWTIINLIIVGGIIVSATVVSFFFEQFRTFLGVSISIWVFAALLIVYALSELGSDIAKMETKPVFFSPWIFPIYIYNPKKNDVEPHNLPSVALIGGLIILILWAVLCSVWVYPYNVGVSLGILFEQTLIICVFHLMQVSSHQLKNVLQDIDRKLIRRAWLDAKLGYINNRSALNREQLLTYEKIRLRRDYFRNFMRVKEERDYLSIEEKNEGVRFIPNEDIDIEWIDESKVNLSNINSCYSFLFDLEKEQARIYKEELELIIQFQLLIVQSAENLQEQKKKYLFTFLNEKKAALFALGIVINIPDQGSMSVRYARVITQIQKLSPEKQTMFNHLRDHYIQEQRDVDEKRKEAARIEEQKERERQELMSQISEEKKKLLAKVTMDMPVDEMPDCEMKYQKILKEGKEGKVFVDAQFKANNDSLGPNCLNRGVSQWVRARDKPNCVLFKDKINHLDVVQGALGDCYFLSAISVLGEKYVRKIIVTTEEEWRETGAIQVQFFKNGEPEIIIIDDFFPSYPNGDWVFVKGGNQGDELWPMVLEKAYAKMYGNYNYIEAGKVQYALSDMTDGFPEQVDLKVDGKNIQQLWEKIKTLKRHGALMGAGSPEHSLGDRAINEMGIVQGHAYAILDVQEVDGHKLMQLRNPHGSAGEEWKGDWSDTCEKWDQRMKNKLSYQEASRDGVFWMEVLDFIQQYSYLYICRILDKDEGWHEKRVQGRWEGASAEGLPSRNNPNARLEFNPQYAITVTKPCDGFIMMAQKDKVNMFKGKHAIFFMVSKNGGKRINKVDKNTMICRSGNPVNLNIITAECDFDKSVTYPYKFTIMIANAEHGRDGEGNFEFAVYATDPNVKVEELELSQGFENHAAAQKEDVE